MRGSMTAVGPGAAHGRTLRVARECHGGAATARGADATTPTLPCATKRAHARIGATWRCRWREVASHSGGSEHRWLQNRQPAPSSRTISRCACYRGRPMKRRHGFLPRPLLHGHPVLRGFFGLALGVGVSLSCGGGRGGRGGVSCPPSTGIECESCLPGENLYICAIQSTNNSICALDDFTADQHCAALGSVVQSKTVCSTHGETGADQGGQSPGGDADGADDTAEGGSESPSEWRRQAKDAPSKDD